MVQKRGFTLIELLVVVLIIGILAAAALPQYQKAVLKSRIVILLPILRSIENAQRLYRLDNGKYTVVFDDLDFSLPSGGEQVSASRVRFENWYCQLFSSPPQANGESLYSAYCGSSAAGSPYIEKYYHEKYFRCWANMQNKMQNAVCRALTGKSVPDHSGGTQNYYRF